MRKIKKIKIDKGFDCCPHCTGPDLNKKEGKMMFTCQEAREWIENENTIPSWCPLEDDPIKPYDTKTRRQFVVVLHELFVLVEMIKDEKTKEQLYGVGRHLTEIKMRGGE